MKYQIHTHFIFKQKKGVTLLVPKNATIRPLPKPFGWMIGPAEHFFIIGFIHFKRFAELSKKKINLTIVIVLNYMF